MNNINKFLFLSIVMLFFAACSKNANDLDLDLGKEGFACREDKTCEDGLSCNVDNICIKTGSCLSDGDCEDGESCVDKVCKEKAQCSSNSECSSEKYCSEKNVCENKCPEDMVFISGGKFNMGSDVYEPWTDPVHEVTISSYCLDKFEFSNKAKELLQKKHTILDAVGKDEDGISKNYQWDEIDVYGGDFNAENHPLVGINWYVANRICELEGKYLPSEEEWEYAARSGKMNDEECKFATDNCELNEDGSNACWSCSVEGCEKKSSCAIDAYKPNTYGLYSMSGNVWEWVSSWFEKYPGNDSSEWDSVKQKTYKGVRGGNWLKIPYVSSSLRVVYRNGIDPLVKNNIIGFRCAKRSADIN